MIIPRELILQAKEKLGEQAAHIIAEDLQLQNFDSKNLKSLCYFHEENSGSFVWNPKQHSYKCFGCGKVYGIIDHYMLHNKMTFIEAVETLFEKTGIQYRFGEKGVKTNKDYVYPRHELARTKTVNDYWSVRGISTETLDYADVGQDEHGNTAFHYYDLNDVLCMVKYRPSHAVKKGENKFWAQKDSSTMPLLYGMNLVDVTKPLVICEGEPDRLAIIESGFHNVVSVPFGANNFTWIEKNWDWLEQFEKIIIWSDNDAVGVEMRKSTCSRLGTWKTLYVDVPEIIDNNGTLIKIKDANDVLYKFGKQKVLDFIDNAQEVPVQNVVDLSTVDDFDIETAQGLYSGIQGLDEIIYKFVFGSVVILTGAKGSGKSTFLNQTFVCEALNQGHDIFMFSGEMGNPILKNWVETTMAGRENIKMKNDFVRMFIGDTKTRMREWYKGRIWSFDDNHNEVDMILDRAVSITRKFGAKIWILDNLMTIDIGTTDTNVWQKQKEFIVRVVNLAKTYGVLIVLVAHPRKTTEMRRLNADDVAGSNDLGNLAQYILGVHRYSKTDKEGVKSKNGGYVKGKEPIEHDVAVDVFKNRYTGKIGEVRMFFDYPSYRFYCTPNELWKRYKWDDKNTAPLNKHDPNQHNDSPDWTHN